jgi:methylmalonyl-CoA decarboxylase subunit alpha
VRDIVNGLVDDSYFLEVHENWARNIVVGFARLNGRSIGIIANQPRYLAGVLDVDASDKAARFIRFCDAFSIPLLTLVDTPGYLPGVDQEHAGVIRHGAKVLYAYSEATVPKLTIIMRKAYGGAYIAMCSRHLGADFVVAWPIGRDCRHGSRGCSEYHLSPRDRDGQRSGSDAAEEDQGVRGESSRTPTSPPAQGYVDVILEPHKTRDALIRALSLTRTKERRICETAWQHTSVGS